MGKLSHQVLQLQDQMGALATCVIVGEKLYVFGGCGLGDMGHLAGTTSSMYMFDTGKSGFFNKCD